MRLVLAESDADAADRGERIGREAEHSYPNELGQSVTWHFDSIVEVVDLCEIELKDGVEVWSRLFRAGSSA